MRFLTLKCGFQTIHKKQPYKGERKTLNDDENIMLNVHNEFVVIEFKNKYADSKQCQHSQFFKELDRF